MRDARGHAPHGGLFLGSAQNLFQAPLFGNVSNEATGVNKFSIFPKAIGVDDDLLDGTVFAAKLRRKIVYVLSPHQLRPELFENVLVGMERAEGMANVFLSGVPQKFQ